jgi:hypothetical protein
VASLDHNLIEPLELELLKCQIAVTVEQLSKDENVKPVRVLFEGDNERQKHRDVQ